MTRILVYTPTYNDLMQPETVESVKALQFDGEREWIVSDENPYPGRDMRNAVFQFRKGRQLALDGDYDGLLLVEHDMIVPPDALQKLWDTDAPVVYATYMLRHGMHSVNLFQYCNEHNIGMSLSLYPRELRDARGRGWARVSGAGFGCLLIKRPVLEKIAFRDIGNAPDLPFATDCVRQGITQIGRLDVVCGHIDSDDKGTLWPFRKGYGIVARVIAQQDVNVISDGQTIAMKKGKYYSISLELATELQRAGYATVTNDADTVAAEETATNKGAETRETTEAKRKTTRRRKTTKPSKAS